MSGEWIKMRTNLWDDPRISSICDATGQSEAAVIGALYWLWSSADEHTEDGIMPGLSLAGIDRKTGIRGIGSALASIGWLAEHPEGVRIIRFEEHNGRSAKRRCTESRRKVSARDADKEQAECGTIAEEMQQECGESAHLEEEKIRRSKPKSKPLAQPSACASEFSVFWEAYPKKRSKGDAEKAWNSLKPDEHLQALILAAVQRAKTREDWIRDAGQFIPYPASWLRDKGWEDGSVVQLPQTVAKAPEVCSCCGQPASKSIGRIWYCPSHDQYSERAAA